jgi:hypothetical protein
MLESSMQDGERGTSVAVLDESATDDVVLLARRHSKRAVERLAELMECGGRQAMVGAMAATAMLKIAQVDEAAVEARIKELIAARKGKPSPDGAG